MQMLESLSFSLFFPFGEPQRDANPNVNVLHIVTDCLSEYCLWFLSSFLPFPIQPLSLSLSLSLSPSTSLSLSLDRTV